MVRGKLVIVFAVCIIIYIYMLLSVGRSNSNAWIQDVVVPF